MYFHVSTKISAEICLDRYDNIIYIYIYVNTNIYAMYIVCVKRFTVYTRVYLLINISKDKTDDKITSAKISQVHQIMS